MRLITAFAAALLASPIAARDIEVVRVHFTDAATVARVAREHTHVAVDRARGVMTLEADAAARERLVSLGLRVEVDRAATAALARTSAPLVTKAGIPGYACYRTVAETRARLDELATLYPALASTVPLGPTWEQVAGFGGEALRVLKLGSSTVSGSKPVVFVMASIHAREYTPAETLLRFAEGLVTGYGSDADATWILDHTELHLLVHANPDGRKKAETGLSWRKNTNQTYCSATSNMRGADLNRNYPFEWGAHNGSSPTPCSDTFRGPAAMSEPETQAVVEYVRALVPDQRGPALTDAVPATGHSVFIDMHSFSRLVMWPWGFTETPAPNAVPLETMGRRLAWFNGYTPQPAIDIYPTDGTTDDFAYGELGLAAFAFELGDAFFESCAVFEGTVAPHNVAALRYAARVAAAPYLLPSGPDALDVATTPDLPIVGEPVTIAARIDDTRFNQSNAGSDPPEPVHAIVAADVTLAGTTVAAGAVDGSFDAPVERVGAVIGALPAGRHLVVVQGRDASAQAGPVGAAYVDVREPDAVGTIAGVVRDAQSGAPLAAKLRVAGYPATSAADGAYARRVPAGTHVLDARALGYAPVAVADVVVPGGTTATRDVAMSSLCPRLADDAEHAPVGWTAQAPWAIANVGADVAWTDSPSGNYAASVNTALTSPVLDLGAVAAPIIDFRSRCDTEAGYDYGRLEIQTASGGAWTEVWRCSGEPGWRDVRVALPALAQRAAARVRFRLTSDTLVEGDGWSLDDIVVHAGSAASCAAQADDVFADGFE